MERGRDRERDEERDRERDRGRGREADRDRERVRFDQRRGETTRIGAGESYKPYGSRPRSPPRTDNFRPNRDRPVRKDRARSPVTDSWYPNGGRDRSPRRRSRTPVRRIRTPPNDSWRARSPRKRTPPRRFSPRRDDNRRARSPPRRDDRRKSRSPFERERMPIRTRSPIRRGSPPAGPRSFRPRSRSIDRRDIPKGPSTKKRRSITPPGRGIDRSILNSKTNSRRSSPRSYTDRIQVPPTHLRPRSPLRASPGSSHRDREPSRPIPRERSIPRSTAPKSPLRGPSGLRPPTGPGGHRNSNGLTSAPSNNNGAPSHSHSRSKIESSVSTVPPAGPRGYNPRGESSCRGGRTAFGGEKMNKQEGASWGDMPTTRPTRAAESCRSAADLDQRASTSVSQQTSTFPTPSGVASASATNGSSGNIPTGPRAGNSSRRSPKVQYPSSNYNRSAQPGSMNNGPRPHPALANIPAIITGGRIDTTASGIAPDISMRLKRKEEEEEALRAELQAKEEKLRQSLMHWDKLSRESSAMGLRSELSEKHVRTLAGEGRGGAF